MGNFSKSGHANNLRLMLVGETYDEMRVGRASISGISQVQLTTENIPCFAVLLQASEDNSQVVYIGNDKDGCYFELPSGGSVTIPINNVNKIFCLPASGTQIVNWIAMT